MQLGAFFAKEVAGPLGADFHIGLDPKHFGRVTNVVPPPAMPVDMSAIDPNSPAMKTFTGPALDATWAWTDAWRKADIGAANGHGNARSVARVQSIVSNGGEVDGVRLLSPKTIDLIFHEQANGTDLVLGLPARFGIGYGLPLAAGVPFLPEGRKCWWGGWGGSVCINDIDNRMTVTYMMNRMSGDGTMGDTRGAGIVQAAYAAIGKAAVAV
jgi:CubicO group peptidase (beta-lactamase class C family)